MTYREIAKKARVTPMAVYFALNPDKRRRYEPKPRSTDELVSRYTRLSAREWAEVGRRAKATRTSAAAMIRRILLGEEPPIQIEPPLEDEA